MVAEQRVSLVIPGRNCASTIGACLSAVQDLSHDSLLREVIFVDDGSTDDTVAIVGEFPVKLIRGEGRGAAAARNIGWQAADHPLIWFVDSDCVVEPDALSLLLDHLSDASVAAVGGSYGIMNPASLLARLIHEEIVERHLAMGERVDFLASFNVIYRREVLCELEGFDERYLKAQDAELSFRVLSAGYHLAFERRSLVKHYHPSKWFSYFRTQRQQGYWRVWLHLSHRGREGGDSYSRVSDHVQPPLAVALLLSLVLLLWPGFRWIPVGLLAGLVAAQYPMTFRLVRRMRRLDYLLFAGMGFMRSFWRGVGMVGGLIGFAMHRGRR